MPQSSGLILAICVILLVTLASERASLLVSRGMLLSTSVAFMALTLGTRCTRSLLTATSCKTSVASLSSRSMHLPSIVSAVLLSFRQVYEFSSGLLSPILLTVASGKLKFDEAFVSVRFESTWLIISSSSKLGIGDIGLDGLK